MNKFPVIGASPVRETSFSLSKLSRKTDKTDRNSWELPSRQCWAAHRHLPLLIKKAARNRTLLQWHIYRGKLYCQKSESQALREHWKLKFHAGLQTISSLKGCRLSNTSAQNLPMYFLLRQISHQVWCSLGSSFARRQHHKAEMDV
jgi:hypothetical protein